MLCAGGISACAIHTRTVTSDPSGATIINGATANSMRPAGATTPQTWRDTYWLSWCFDATMPGYASDGPRCLPGGAEDESVHFVLTPIASVASSTPNATALPPHPHEVFVTAGGISQPFEVLGPVHIDTVGMVNLGSALSDALFKSRLERAVQGATPTIRQDQAFQALKEMAIQQYGASTDAVVNATYRVESNGTVFSDGLAVRFVNQSTAIAPASATRQTPEERLKQLKSLLDQKLISPKDYERKRAEIIREL
jgi:hypothetical protein